MNHQNSEPKIIIKTYDLYTNFYIELRKWPKPERYNLGQRSEELILTILEMLIAASRTQAKSQLLRQANLKLQVLKILIRLAKDIKVMEKRKYLFFQKKLLEIGRMLGGWLKST